MYSGNYESYWKNAQKNWSQVDYHKIVSKITCDLIFGFDEQSPPTNMDDHITLVVERWKMDQNVAGDRRVIPIVHSGSSELPELCARVIGETGVDIIGVPERRLGNGIVERALSLKAIRSSLNKLGRYVLIHVLGTGNPASIAFYSAMGADSFDGLEWCQTVVDHDTGTLHHLSHIDFFRLQTPWGESEKLSFHAQVLAHNIDFISRWMEHLRNAMHRGFFRDFCYASLPKRVCKYFNSIVDWEEV